MLSYVITITTRKEGMFVSSSLSRTVLGSQYGSKTKVTPFISGNACVHVARLVVFQGYVYLDHL